MPVAKSFPEAFAINLGDVAVREVRYRGGWRQSRHAHRGTSVTLLYRGSLEERVGSRVEQAGPLSVVVKPGGVEHLNRYGPGGADTLLVRLSPALDRDLDEWGSGLGAWRWLHGGPAARHLVGLLGVLRAPDVAHTVVRDRVYELVGLLSQSDRHVRPDAVPDWLRRVRQSIDDRSTERLQVQQLAAEANVHPVYLARVFRRHYGSTVTQYCKRARVRAAAKLIAGTSLPLAAVAYGVGFSDQAHLCRQFRSESGVTPRRFRRLARVS